MPVTVPLQRVPVRSGGLIRDIGISQESLNACLIGVHMPLRTRRRVALAQRKLGAVGPSDVPHLEPLKSRVCIAVAELAADAGVIRERERAWSRRAGEIGQTH